MSRAQIFCAFVTLALCGFGSADGYAAAVPVSSLQAALSTAALTEPIAVIVRRRGPAAVVVRPGIVAPRTVVVRPVRPWVRRPHYGVVIGGIVLGTIIGATVVGVAPVAPSPDLCWYWVDPRRTRGYWDYCPGVPIPY